MFGSRYFGGRYFGARFFGHRGYNTPAGVRGAYMGPRYFGRRYFNQKSAEADGEFFGPRYFGLHYFGQGYFKGIATVPFELDITAQLPALSATLPLSSVTLVLSADWELAQSNVLALTGDVALDANLFFLGEEWAFTPPLEVTPTVGSLTFSADFAYAATPVGVGRYFGKTYFGRDYFGPWYWGTSDTWELEATAALTLTGAGTASADITLALSIDPTTLAAIGTATLAGDLLISQAVFSVAQTNTLAATAAVTLAGDLRFDVVEALAVTSGLTATGALTFAGDFSYDAIAYLYPTPLAASGAISLRLPYGDFVFSRPGAPESDYPEDGGPTPTRPRWRRQYARGWLGAFVDPAAADTPGATPDIQ